MRSALIAAALTFATLSAHAQSHEAAFTNAGLTLHYTVEGSGSPVVILAGGPGFDAGYMQPVADLVAKHHTAILLDQRGTTGSMPATLDPTTITPELYLSDLEALRTALHYDKWTVLGHSAGTGTAMAYAIQHPEHVTSLVLLATVPPTSTPLEHMDENMVNRLPADAPQQFHAVMISNASPDEKMAASVRILNPAYFYDQKAAQDFIAKLKPENAHAATSQILQHAGMPYDDTAGLAKLHTPTTIIQGRQDPLDLGMAFETRDAIPGAKLVIIEKCGHFAWLDNPTDFTPALEAALSQPIH